MWLQKGNGIARSGFLGGVPITFTLTTKIISAVQRSFTNKIERVVL